MEPTTSPSALFYRSISDLPAVAARNIERWEQVRKKSEELRTALDRGDSLAEAVRRESRPRIVELVTENIAALEEAGSKVRRSEAVALRAEGLTLAEIGNLFGVSRQRVAELLAQPADK